MAFVFFTVGDALPSVTTAQILLRRHRPGATITSDGRFGPRTKAATSAYQKAHPPLTGDGIIGPNTWNSMMNVSGFQTVDLVDGTDPSLVNLEARDITLAGGSPIIVYGQSNGLIYAMQQVAARARPGNLALLRIHGHGNRGMQNVTGGEIYGAPHMASISLERFEQSVPALMLIRDRFVGFGAVQLLGCEVGGGSPGRELVRRLAQTWGVPVTAGVNTQFGGGNRTFRFEGPTVSGYPNMMDLGTWSAQAEANFGNVTMPN